MGTRFANIPSWCLNNAIVESRLRPSTELIVSTSSLYRWVKYGWNLGSYACGVLSPVRNTHDAPYYHYVKTWRHLQNRKYITYRNAVRGPIHGHKQLAQNIILVKFGCEVFYLCEWTDRQTDRQTSTLITILRSPPGVKWFLQLKQVV